MRRGYCGLRITPLTSWYFISQVGKEWKYRKLVASSLFTTSKNQQKWRRLVDVSEPFGMKLMSTCFKKDRKKIKTCHSFDKLDCTSLALNENQFNFRQYFSEHTCLTSSLSAPELFYRSTNPEFSISVDSFWTLCLLLHTTLSVF